jgi:hypothetical protein
VRCQLAQLIINEWQKRGGGMGIALLDGGQEARHFRHGRHRTRREKALDVL